MANAATYLEIFNEVKLKLNNHKMLLSVVTHTEYQNLTALGDNFLSTSKKKGERSSTVVKVLRYKSEGRWFDPRWCHWNFSLT